MSNEKWYPKVGQEFEWRYNDKDNWDKQTCIAVTKVNIGYENIKSGFLMVTHKDYDFRPVPNKQDVEREELLLILGCTLTDEHAVDAIQSQGFTIPKKVKRRDIYWHANLNAFDKDGARAITDAICELLGDLVEQGDE